MATVVRKYIDCREFPSEIDCSLYISGTQDEVLACATQHAISTHKHEMSPELTEQLLAAMKDEPLGARL
jgi:hypothetical protein